MIVGWHNLAQMAANLRATQSRRQRGGAKGARSTNGGRSDIFPPCHSLLGRVAAGLQIHHQQGFASGGTGVGQQPTDRRIKK